MIITIKQESRDSKEKYIKLVEFIEHLGYDIFDIGSYDPQNKLSEATLINLDKTKQINDLNDRPEFES